MSSGRDNLIHDTINAVMLLAQVVKGTPTYEAAEADVVRLGKEYLQDDAEIEEPYTLDEALRYARLWRAGKLIGGNSDSVIFALLAEIERTQSDGGADGR
jgi:hypothetical protein